MASRPHLKGHCECVNCQDYERAKRAYRWLLDVEVHDAISLTGLRQAQELLRRIIGSDEAARIRRDHVDPPKPVQAGGDK